MRNALKRIPGCVVAARALRRAALRCFDAGIGMLPVVRRRAPAFDRESVKAILVIRIDRIGDMVLSTPALRALRAAYPSARIDVLAGPAAKDLLAGNPHLNRVLVRGKDPLPRGYDLAIALHPGIMPNYYAWRSGARWRIGWGGGGGEPFLTLCIPDDRAVRARHEVTSALEVVAKAGATADTTALELRVNDQARAAISCFLKGRGVGEGEMLAVVHPGSRQPYLRWSASGFAAVGAQLAKEFRARVVVTGSAAERSLVRFVCAGIPDAIEAVGLPLPQLVALIARATLFVGNSTGPMHVACALDVPTVAVFGPTHPLDSAVAWGPWGKGHAVVSGNMNCRCDPGRCAQEYACFKKITPEDVLKEIRWVIKNTRHRYS